MSTRRCARYRVSRPSRSTSPQDALASSTSPGKPRSRRWSPPWNEPGMTRPTRQRPSAHSDRASATAFERDQRLADALRDRLRFLRNARAHASPSPPIDDPTCPLLVPETTLTVEDTQAGPSFVFITTGDVEEVRTRGRALAEMHNDREGPHGAFGLVITGVSSDRRGEHRRRRSRHVPARRSERRRQARRRAPHARQSPRGRELVRDVAG